MASDPLHFWKKYELINSMRNFKEEFPLFKVCRFCKRNENQTSFHLKAHIIPELLGRNNFLASDECDECNQKFSAYESHLSKFFMPYLTMNGVEGKRGVPAFHSRTISGDEDTRTIIRSSGIKRGVLLGDMNDYKVDKEGKKMTVVFRKPPHKPLWAYKSLVKIGLSMLPIKEYGHFEGVTQWLLNKPAPVICFAMATMSVLTYRKFSGPFADLYQAKRILYSKSFVPEFTLVVGFGNVLVQVFLPLSSNPVYQRASAKMPSLIIFPGFALDDFERKKSGGILFVDLQSAETITYDQRLEFTFKESDFDI